MLLGPSGEAWSKASWGWGWGGGGNSRKEGRKEGEESEDEGGGREWRELQRKRGLIFITFFKAGRKGSEVGGEDAGRTERRRVVNGWWLMLERKGGGLSFGGR